ncbi:hypothetical protein HDU76_006996 [Blyttiomyces sp. JEL0837]|nr:hypothetical protein HDU76_006996 [Blyttiomyces sp. JEL0837]
MTYQFQVFAAMWRMYPEMISIMTSAAIALTQTGLSSMGFALAMIATPFQTLRYQTRPNKSQFRQFAAAGYCISKISEFDSTSHEYQQVHLMHLKLIVDWKLCQNEVQKDTPYHVAVMKMKAPRPKKGYSPGLQALTLLNKLGLVSINTWLEPQRKVFQDDEVMRLRLSEPKDLLTKALEYDHNSLACAVCNKLGWGHAFDIYELGIELLPS